MRYHRRSTIADIYAHPVGRDAVDKVLLQLGRSPRWVRNPVVGRLRLDQIARVAGRYLDERFIDSLLALLNGVPETVSTSEGPTEPPWWRSAVFYQVYPRSFLDSDGDGVGDIRGIISRLDYLADLGVDCLWLSPIFASPNEDMGYDISDYRDIMTEMGTLADVDELIAGCHRRGMRIILDLVVNHTSDEHEWFRKARQDPDGQYGHYYHFREGDPDQPPNNWVSFFSGPAWRWLDDAQRWVLRLFAPGQPDLNWDNPAVRDEVHDLVQWWLERGIDGFRLDVINYISKHDGLPDGSELVGQLVDYTGIERYFHGPRLHEYLRELRLRGFTRPGHDWEGGPGRDPVGVMIGETPGIGIEGARLLSGHDRHELDLTFVFDHLASPGRTRWDDATYELEYLKQHFIGYLSRLTGNDWAAIFWENHDNPRLISKIDPRPESRTPLGKVLATILLTLQGTPFIYQGQEIAAINQDFVSVGDLRDIESLNRCREVVASGGDGLEAVLVGTRDHARTPMRWTPEPQHGFTTGEPWIGFHETSEGYTVAEQLADPSSVLSWYKDLIAVRRAHPALALGRIRFVDTRIRNYFGYYRELDGQTFFVELNLAGEPRPRPRPVPDGTVVLGTATALGPVMDPYEVLITRLG